jgi:hypothetical protein
MATHQRIRLREYRSQRGERGRCLVLGNGSTVNAINGVAVGHAATIGTGLNGVAIGTSAIANGKCFGCAWLGIGCQCTECSVGWQREQSAPDR